MAAAGMIAAIGAAHIDRRGMLRGPLIPGTSNPGTVRRDFGGVAANVTVNLARLGQPVTMFSRVGNDEDGRQVIANLAAAGVDTALVGISAVQPTASYTAILENSGELVLGLADMDIYEEMDREAIDAALPRLRGHGRWFIDANVPGGSIAQLLAAAGEIPAAVDAVSVVKSRRLRPLLQRIPLLFANVAQAAAIADMESIGDGAAAAGALHRLGARAGVVTAGSRPAAVWSGDEMRVMPVVAATPRDVTGAGDALIAGTLFGLVEGRELFDAVRLGMAAAAITIECLSATAAELSPARLEARAGA